MSKTKSFIFKGKQSFSSTKLEQISREFYKLNQLEAKINSNEIYFIQLNSNQSDLAGIKDILSATEYEDDFSFYVGPRLGTISPWSSKTEDIIKNVGLDNVLRVERLFGFQINCDLDQSNFNASMFYDRMTQSIYTLINKSLRIFLSLIIRDL